MPKTSGGEGLTGPGRGCVNCPRPRTLANTSSSSVSTPGQGRGFPKAAPPLRYAPKPEGTQRRRAGWGARDPRPGDQSAAAGGGPQPSPPTLPGALGEERFLCPFVSSWGPPKPRSPHCSGGGWGDPDRAALSPHRGPSPAAGALDSSWARQEAGEGSGAPKVRCLDRGVGRRGLAALGPPPLPWVALGLALRAPPPNTSLHRGQQAPSLP